MTTAELREHFLIEEMMKPGKMCFTYSHYDRVIIGGAVPEAEALPLKNVAMLKADYFLERREMGIINVGAAGTVTVDGAKYDLGKKDCLYIGKGNKDVSFTSVNADAPAIFYILSTTAHSVYPTVLMKAIDASPMTVGSTETANHRTVYKYIFADGIKSCQLVMGLTVLNTGSVWNTMPAHTHDRRMEAYFYFDVANGQTVFHFMGQPQETRHITVHNHQAVISPPWSIHSGCGTGNYSFIWGMAGENQDYSDMDIVNIAELK